MNLTSALRLSLQPAAPDVVTLTGGGGKTTTLFRLAGEVVALRQRAVATTSVQMPARKLEQSPAHVIAKDELPFEAIRSALDAHGQCLLTGPLAETARGLKATAVPPALIDALAAWAGDAEISAIIVEGDGSRRRPMKAPAAHEPVVPQSTTLLVPMFGIEALGRQIAEPFAHRPELMRSVLALPAAGDARLTAARAAQLLTHPAGGGKGLPAGARLLPLLNKVDGPLELTTARLVASLLNQQGYGCLIGRVGNEEASPVRERWEPVVAVVLAAGASRRMGRAKQLEVVDGEPMVVRAARLALQSGAQHVLVVTGAYADEVTALLKPLQKDAPLHIAHNPAWESGQASSVRTAVNALQNQVLQNQALRAGQSQFGAALIMPVDQPYMDASALRALVQRWRSGATIAAPSVEGVVRGAPALFDRQCRQELLELRGDEGAKPILQRHQKMISALPLRAEMLNDIDSPADLSLC